MSQLLKSLEKRIQELTKSIAAQQTELAAFERALKMETSPSKPTPASAALAKHVKVSGAAPAGKGPIAPYSGNKTTLISDIVRSYGRAGASPKEVDAFFTEKKIARTQNLIYNTLSYLVAQKKLQRQDGKYYAITGVAPVKKTVSALAKKTSVPVKAPTERRLSPEGLKKIQEALKRRWAAKRASEAAAKKAPAKSAGKKK